MISKVKKVVELALSWTLTRAWPISTAGSVARARTITGSWPIDSARPVSCARSITCARSIYSTRSVTGAGTICIPGSIPCGGPGSSRPAYVARPTSGTGACCPAAWPVSARSIHIAIAGRSIHGWSATS